jgi:hypothetical protein
VGENLVIHDTIWMKLKNMILNFKNPGIKVCTLFNSTMKYTE